MTITSPHRVHRSITAISGLLLMTGLTACSEDDSPTAGDQTTPPTTTSAAGGSGDDARPENSGAATAQPSGDKTAVALQAIATAESDTGGTAYEIDDEDDDGTWEVDVRAGDKSVEVKVSADGASVASKSDDDLDDDDRNGLDAASITLPDAINAAIAHAGGVLDDAELEEENGKYYWEVTVDGANAGDDVDVKIDVTNGAVVGG